MYASLHIESDEKKYVVKAKSSCRYFSASSCYDIYRYCLRTHFDFDNLIYLITQKYEDDEDSFYTSPFCFISFEDLMEMVDNGVPKLEEFLKGLSNESIAALFCEATNSDGSILGYPDHYEVSVDVYEAPKFTKL